MTKRRFFKDISILLISLVLGVASLLSSCDNISESQSEKTPAVPAGIILVTASVAPENKAARFAAPDALDDATNFDYSATLTVTGGSPSFLVSGTYDTSTKKVTFSFDTPSATTGITIDIYAHLKSESNPTVANAVLHATKENLSISAGTIAVGEITLSPNSGNTANGTASLSITLPSSDYTLTASCATGTFTVEGTSPNVTVKGNDLSAGAYTIVFTVKKGEEIVYIWKEVINIYAGMETNSWKSIADNGTVSTSDKKTIEDATIQAAALTTFFVRGSDATWYGTNLSTATSDDSNPGTVSRPLATVQKAIDKVKAANDGVTKYTIYVDGTFTAESGKNVAKIENQDTPNLKLSIIGLGTSKSIFNGNNTSVVFVRGFHSTNKTNHLKLKLENIKITNGKTPSGTLGGGINAGINDMSSSCGKLMLVNCEISGNTATDAGGGGISFYGYTESSDTEARLILDNCIITNNNAKYGGGIIAYGGTVHLTNGTIIGDATETLATSSSKGNSSTGNGGGITLSNNRSATLVVDENCIIGRNYCSGGTGGGICLQNGATLTLKSGAKIQYNVASSNGGGIHSTSALTIPSGVEIIGNSATENGGGVYVCNGTLTVNGGTISSNEAKTTEAGKTTNGGAIFVAHDESKGTTGNVVLQGGIIKCNSATYGGAIFIEPGASATIQKNTATNSIVTIGGESSSEANEATIGGAIYNMGTLLISDGEIKSNKAEVAGAIFNYSSLSITGGTISDNIATAGSSNGIYQSGSQFNVSGKFRMNPADDIYLYCDVANSIFYTILIAGPLENAAPVATVTPVGHVDNYPVVRLKEGVTTTTLATEAPKFAVTPESDGTKWKVNASGNLEKDTGGSTTKEVTFNDSDTINVSAIGDLSTVTELKITATINTEDKLYDITELISSLSTNYADAISISLTLTGNIETIEADVNGVRVFNECISLTEVSLVGLTNLKTLGKEAFKECENLEKITLPDSVTEIGESAFENCASLETINLPNGITKIDNNAFKYCDSLESITLPNNLTYIGYMAFYRISNIPIIIPASVEKIGAYAFDGGAYLGTTLAVSSVTFEKKTNWYMTTNADFLGGEPITISDNGEENASKFFSGEWSDKYLYNSDVLSVEDAQQLLANASDNTTISSLSIDFENIGDMYTISTKISEAKARGVEINEIYLSVAIDNANYTTGLGNAAAVISLANEKGHLEIQEMQNGIKAISNTFENNKKLASIVIPSTVTSIVNQAFNGCENLESITFKGATPPTIGLYVFYNCPSSLVIHVPEGAKSAYEGVITGVTIVDDVTN